MSTTLDRALVADLSGLVSGTVLLPDDAGYDATRADDPIRAAYGPNYQRLREVKRRYDQENVIHSNHNIAP